MKTFLAYSFYNLIISLVLLFEFSKWFRFLLSKWHRQLRKWPAKENAKRETLWGQKYGLIRFNHFERCDKSEDNKNVLVHCASMGEVIAAMPMIIKMAESQANFNFIITTNTLTGREQVFKSIPAHLTGRFIHNYIPIDTPWLMAKLINKVQPNLVLIMEVELWPNLVRQCFKRRIPMAIINARLTDSTMRGYQKFHWLSQPMVQSLCFVFCRNQNDYDNYIKLGIKPSKLQLLGNIKFDITLPALSQNQTETTYRQQLNLQDRKVIIAGSTHQGEEEAMVMAYQQLKSQFNDLLLIIVPRHPERFREVGKYLKAQQLITSSMSNKEAITANTDVLLCDMMGKLTALYGVADMAFVGGSIKKVGGHNPIEASAFALPVIMGQHIYNNPEICQTLADAGGLVICPTQEQINSTFHNWLSSTQERARVGQLGLTTIQNHQGITDKLIAILLNHLEHKQC